MFTILLRGGSRGWESSKDGSGEGGAGARFPFAGQQRGGLPRLRQLLARCKREVHFWGETEQCEWAVLH